MRMWGHQLVCAAPFIIQGALFGCIACYLPVLLTALWPFWYLPASIIMPDLVYSLFPGKHLAIMLIQLGSGVGLELSQAFIVVPEIFRKFRGR